MVWILGVVFEFDWMIGRGFYDFRLFVKMGSSGNALFLFCVVFFFSWIRRCLSCMLLLMSS